MVYLSHVDDSYSQSLVAKDGSILVAFPPLQHNLQSVGISLQKMWVLEVTPKNKGGLTMQTASCMDIKMKEGRSVPLWRVAALIDLQSLCRPIQYLFKSPLPQPHTSKTEYFKCRLAQLIKD